MRDLAVATLQQLGPVIAEQAAKAQIGFQQPPVGGDPFDADRRLVEQRSQQPVLFNLAPNPAPDATIGRSIRLYTTAASSRAHHGRWAATQADEFCRNLIWLMV